MSDNNGEVSNRPACAACKYQRKKCSPKCVLRRHFPATEADGFKSIHNVFGIVNVKRKLEQFGPQQQVEIAKSIKWEAKLWDQDPVHGPYGCYKKVKEEVEQLKQENRNNQQRLLYMQNIIQQPFVNTMNYFQANQENLGVSSCLPATSLMNREITMQINQPRSTQRQQQQQQQQQRQGIVMPTRDLQLRNRFPCPRAGQWAMGENFGSSGFPAPPFGSSGEDGSQMINAEGLELLYQQQYMDPHPRQQHDEQGKENLN